jgi:signal transduction histidine kinase
MFVSIGATSNLRADKYKDSLQALIVNLDNKNTIDTLLNTRLELIKYVKNSDYDLFLELAGQSIVQAQEYKKNWALIDIYMEIGEVLITKGIFAEALNNLNKALRLAENDEYKPYKGWISIAIGNAYNGMFNYSKGIEFYNTALNVFTETEDIDGIGLAATNLGVNYSKLNDRVKAKYFLKMGIEYREKLGNPIELGFSKLYNYDFEIILGNYSLAESELKALEKFLENTLSTDKTNIQFQEAMILHAGVFSLLAVCENHYGNFKNEFFYLEKAIEIYQKIDDDLNLAITLNQIGNRYLEEGKYVKALDYADSALEIAKKSSILTEQSYSLKLKADAYDRLGKYEGALQFFKAHKTINDSIYNSSVIQAISNVDVLVKTKEKEKDIFILSMKLTQDRKLRFLIIAVSISFILLTIIYGIFISQRYKKEKRLSLMLKEKNQRISEQTEILEKLNQELVHLNKSKDRFHAIIAHDLKSPVASLSGIIELIHETYETMSDENRKAFIGMAHQAAEHNLKLLDNLLTWSRIQGGHLTINKSDFYINDIIIGTIEALHDIADLKNILLETTHFEQTKIFADKEMITSVIRNLCTNAIKYTHSGQKIQMGMKKSDEMIEVWVQDHGIGIPKGKLDELFKIDSQIQRKGTNNESGTGLGLQLCYEFIKLHNGKITIESEEGKGSRFTFIIPIEKSGYKV